jgi:hypothetical protein
MSGCVTVHIGLHKTASSLIQKALAREQGALSGRLGLLGRKINDLHGLHMFGPLCRAGEADPDLLAAAPRDLPGAIAARGLDPDGPLLITEEDMMGSFRMDRPGRAYPHVRPVAAALAETFGDRLRFVVYLRDPPSYFVSTFAQRIQSGHIASFEKYRRHFRPGRMRWVGVVEDLAGVVGRDNVHVVLYDEIAADAVAYCNQVLRFHDGLSLPAAAIKATPVNRGLPERGLKACIAAYPYLEREERKALKLFLQKTLPQDGARYFPLTQEEIRTFLDGAREDLLALAEAVAPDRRDTVLAWADPAYHEARR